MKARHVVLGFGAYNLASSLVYMAVPGLVVSFLGLEPMPTAWGRVLGALVFVIGSYEVLLGWLGDRRALWGSAVVKWLFVTFSALMVIYGCFSRGFLAFALPDFVSAVLTVWLLEKEDRQRYA